MTEFTDATAQWDHDPKRHDHMPPQLEALPICWGCWCYGCGGRTDEPRVLKWDFVPPDAIPPGPFDMHNSKDPRSHRWCFESASMTDPVRRDVT